MRGGPTGATTLVPDWQRGPGEGVTLGGGRSKFQVVRLKT